MADVSTATVSVETCANGRVVRTWSDDGQINVQLATPAGVELSRARFDGWRALDMAALVGTAWQEANR